MVSAAETAEAMLESDWIELVDAADVVEEIKTFVDVTELLDSIDDILSTTTESSKQDPSPAIANKNATATVNNDTPPAPLTI